MSTGIVHTQFLKPTIFTQPHAITAPLRRQCGDIINMTERQMYICSRTAAATHFKRGLEMQMIIFAVSHLKAISQNVFQATDRLLLKF